jgi:hypothetical protein
LMQIVRRPSKLVGSESSERNHQAATAVGRSGRLTICASLSFH